MVERYPLINSQLEGGPFYWEAGPVGIQLIHGYTATTVEVRRLAKILHEKGYTVAGPLLPGHGTSPQDANRYKWQDWVMVVEASYQQLRTACPRVIIGGESTGAVLALYLASQHPEVAGVLAYAPALKLNSSPILVSLLPLLATFVTAIPKGEISNETKWQGYPVNPLKGAVQLVRFQKVVNACLKRISQPVLIVQGRKDDTVSAQAPQMIYDGVQSKIKELHWMKASGHTVLLDVELDQIADLTLRFLEQVLKESS